MPFQDRSGRLTGAVSSAMTTPLFRLSSVSFPKNLYGLAVAGLFFLIITVFVPFGRVFEFDIDEGLYLMRAYMHLKGYALYREVWMDHPPVLVLMLSWVFKLFGPSVQAARLLMLSFSALLLWAVYQIVSRTYDHAAALLAVILVAVSVWYVSLSVAVMGSVPAVALSALALYGVVLYRANLERKYLVFSGAVFALAVLTKFFSLIYLFPMLIGILRAKRVTVAGRNMAEAARYPGFLWFAAFFAAFLLVSFGFCSVNYLQILKPYLASYGAQGHHWQSLAAWLAEEYDVALLAAGVLLFSAREDREKLWMPAAGVAAGLVVFSLHSPIWYHHRLYFVVPLCWLASSAGYIMLATSKQYWRRDLRELDAKIILPGVFLCGALVLSAARLPVKVAAIPGLLAGHAQPEYPGLMSLMKKYRGQAGMVVTDRPVFPFYADLPVHPFLVSSSMKRLKTGLLTPGDFIRIIMEERPGMVLFARYRWFDETISPYLGGYRRYTETTSDFPVLYILETPVNPVPRRRYLRQGSS
ncbi:MAG: hypothetical protein A2234_00640 [Elusimicrobia bacterium RIFOXYA2_FULL_58_8]|nr:MAG: hypothetical protein A2285_06540 [Elusimicrobia bacterium RIFOXYA12_FULL_57_11]OGS12720.1 MAG: hypothetical protein A2234_00640 [Elusimicrobia bacterium RIFOXYA2_FULL_58_8]